jgi:hypothetical protein
MRRAARDGDRPCTPFCVEGAVRLRGGRQGAAALPAPTARDFVPWIPDSMHSYAERLMCMPVGREQPAADLSMSRYNQNMSLGQWRQLVIRRLAQRRHAPIVRSCGKHHSQNVSQAFESRQREEHSPLTEREPSVREEGARGVQPPRRDTKGSTLLSDL